MEDALTKAIIEGDEHRLHTLLQGTPVWLTGVASCYFRTTRLNRSNLRGAGAAGAPEAPLLSESKGGHSSDDGASEVSQPNAEPEEQELWPLLAAVKCRKPDVARLLVEAHHARSRCDARGRSELHALAESQRGPFPPLPVRFRPLHHYHHFIIGVQPAYGRQVTRGASSQQPTLGGASGQPSGTNRCASC